MKIAILTLPLHTNYGGILQAYALQTVLERMGHEVEHLQPKVEYKRLHSPLVMPLVWSKRLYRKLFKGDRELSIFKHPYKWVRENTDRFISRNLKCRYLSPDEWNEELAEEYDTIVVGSDQVWRPLYTDVKRSFTAFLGHSEIRRVAYAASFGVDTNEFSEDEISAGKEYLKLFSGISVRESSGVELCKSLFDVDAQCVLDPTMLLPCSDYQKFAASAPQSSGNLMVHILDNSDATEAFVSQFARTQGLTAFNTNSKKELSWDIKVPLAERKQAPLENWLRGFIDAEFVLTDSFHACVFSILFHKPFGVFVNRGRGLSRIKSLLHPLGLMDRCITDTNVDLDKPIDWDKVDDIIFRKRLQSMDFIKEAL